MNKIIECFLIFCVLAYKYKVLFISIITLLTAIEIFEDIQEEKAKQEIKKENNQLKFRLYQMQQEQKRQAKSKKMFEMLKEL